MLSIQMCPHETQPDSVFPNAGTDTQDLIGLITEITINTKPKWKNTCSATIELPLETVTEFRSFVQKNSPLVACELMDANSMKNVTKTPHYGMTLLLKWASEDELDLDIFWESLVDEYPIHVDHMTIADSFEKEEKLWVIRHEVSDANRRWAKENNMNYIGYDLGIPKHHLSHVLDALNQHVSNDGGQFFCFGHSLQSDTHDTIHCNVAMPRQVPKDFIPLFIRHELNEVGIQMAVEHGGCGHKSIHDSLMVATNVDMNKLILYLNQYDPHQLFRRDLKIKMGL